MAEIISVVLVVNYEQKRERKDLNLRDCVFIAISQLGKINSLAKTVKPSGKKNAKLNMLILKKVASVNDMAVKTLLQTDSAFVMCTPKKTKIRTESLSNDAPIFLEVNVKYAD